jgi:hypothetical protein
MMLVTLIAMQIFGNLLSMFAAAWIMIGWHAYKGDLQSANSWSKWAVFIGIGLVILLYLFIGDNNNPVTMRVKNQSAIGIGVMAVPLTLLYFYLVGQMTKIVNNTEVANDKDINSKKNYNSTPNIYTSSTAPLNNKPASVVASINASSSLVKDGGHSMTKTENTTNNISEPLTEDWEKSLNEYESENRIKGLWAKLFADNNGDENIVKAQYIKFRAAEIAAVRRKEIEDRRSNIFSHASNEDCIKNSAMIQIKSNTTKFPVFKLANGNYTIYVSWRYKTYSSLENLNRAIDMFNDTELFSKDGFIEDIDSK